MRPTTSTKPKKGHSQRSHALLSASKASRWINCTPSARLEDEYGEQKSSPYAAEGTLAHELAEFYLRKDVLDGMSESEFASRLEELSSDANMSDEMLDMVAVYTQYCADQYRAAVEENSAAIIEIEQRLDLTEFVPESFGTADCVIINDGVLEVIDLKYGKGVPVQAEWNKQLMLYGLGALYKYSLIYDIHEVRVTIVQPRLDNISSFQLSVEELQKWADEELRPRAELAFAGEGELAAGEWCRFCAVRQRCRKLYEQQMEIARHEFAEPDLLSDEEIADIVKRAPKFVEWVDSITEYARAKAVSEDKCWPGLKLVEGVRRRKWADEDTAADAILSRCKELSPEDVFDTKLKSITSVEKMLGKKRFSEILSDVVVLPQGKPTLVSEDDKRPAMGIAQAIADFSE